MDVLMSGHDSLPSFTELTASLGSSTGDNVLPRIGTVRTDGAGGGGTELPSFYEGFGLANELDNNDLLLSDELCPPYHSLQSGRCR